MWDSLRARKARWRWDFVLAGKLKEDVEGDSSPELPDSVGRAWWCSMTYPFSSLWQDRS